MTLRDPVAELAAELSPAAHAQRLSLYVALGDSFTAGASDGEEGEVWPKLLVDRLREQHPTLVLHNLAVEGATSGEVLGQLPEAVELEPDLVTIVCGANDVLRCTRPDPDGYAANLALILGRLRVAHPGLRLVTATSPERWDFMQMGPRTRRRIERGISAFNGVTRRLSGAMAVPCLEVAGHPGLADPSNFSADGLHPSAMGHQHAAQGFAALLRDRYGIEMNEPGGER